MAVHKITDEVWYGFGIAANIWREAVKALTSVLESSLSNNQKLKPDGEGEEVQCRRYCQRYSLVCRPIDRSESRCSLPRNTMPLDD